MILLAWNYKKEPKVKNRNIRGSYHKKNLRKQGIKVNVRGNLLIKRFKFLHKCIVSYFFLVKHFGILQLIITHLEKND